MDHWRRGHKQMCKKIHRGGNAEQYYADKKYKEAVAEAVEACADDTKGQTCFICTQALHWKTKEGLVRGCACRGTAGFAHVRLRLDDEEDRETLRAANNYAWGLFGARRFEEAKALLRQTLPVARRVLGESNDLTLRMKWTYAGALCANDDATLDDLREAVTTLDESLRTARRVLGGAHPLTVEIEDDLRDARAALRARETPSPPG